MKYKIRGTKVTSPYPVQPTPAETRLIFALQKLFDPINILVDCFYPAIAQYSDQLSDTDLLSPHTLDGELTTSVDCIQIDCLAINQQGVFIFESKDYRGWIFGNGAQTYWTQVLNFGKEKHRFYNPVRQNSAHLRAIKDLFSPNTPVYSVIVFGRDTTLRSIDNLPADTYVCTQGQILTLIPQIHSHYTLSESDIIELRTALQQARIAPSAVLRHQHQSEISSTAANLRQKLS